MTESNLPSLVPPSSKSGKQLKLKRKVIYTYEYSDDEGPAKVATESQRSTAMLAAGQRPNEDRISQSITPIAKQENQYRGLSLEQRNQSNTRLKPTSQLAAKSVLTINPQVGV